MLIDRFLPKYDVVERHRESVRAPANRTYESVKRLDLARSPSARLLFAMRGLPARSFTLDDAAHMGFVVLGEEPGEEIVLGVVGRFWTLRGGIVPIEPDAFTTFEDAGYAKAAWNFWVREGGPESCSVLTETRVLCTDDASRRKFRRYWRLVGPFSALVRRRALALVKREAERTQES
jgi:hypothetical protein